MIILGKFDSLNETQHTAYLFLFMRSLEFCKSQKDRHDEITRVDRNHRAVLLCINAQPGRIAHDVDRVLGFRPGTLWMDSETSQMGDANAEIWRQCHSKKNNGTKNLVGRDHRNASGFLGAPGRGEGIGALRRMVLHADRKE